MNQSALSAAELSECKLQLDAAGSSVESLRRLTSTLIINNNEFRQKQERMAAEIVDLRKHNESFNIERRALSLGSFSTLLARRGGTK